MLTRYFSLIFVILLFVACTNQQTKLPLSGEQSRVQTRPMPAFNKISVQGGINLSLYTGYPRSSIVLRGDPRDLSLTSAAVKDGLLTINTSKGAPHYGAIAVEIRTRYLNAFSYKGEGTITGNRIRSGLLDLEIDNPGQTALNGSIVLRRIKATGGGTLQVNGVSSQDLKIDISGKTKLSLTGVMSISNLDLKGEGSLNMYWIKSPRFVFRGKGKVNLQLAGIVDQLDVELWDNAHFNGRYLRAKNAFVKTHDRARAELTAIKHQHSLAMDASDIYYYKIPDTKADFMTHQGAVLDMRDWNSENLPDYDRYNKEPH